MAPIDASRSAAPAAFGLYIHWPFCQQKCPYCDFNSHVRHDGWDEARFLAAYLRELDHVAGLMSNGGAGAPVLSSIFVGGGTPSLMAPKTVAGLIDHAAKLWPLSPDAEITLEANPGSVEATRFAGYKAAGINRISMGFQSLRDEQLKALGRIHTVAEAKAALGIARRTFERVSFDLIYARPGQTLAEWRAELGEALRMAEGHVSLYQLTIEPGTPYEALHRAGKLVVPDGEASLALYEVTQEMTERAGLPAYEISNHAQPGEESRHNLLYWRYGAYAGVGPGAHGRLPIGGVRHATVGERHPETWAGHVEGHGHGFGEITPLSRAEEADEMLLMGLRLKEGLDLASLGRVAGVRPSDVAIDELCDLGLLERWEAPDSAGGLPDGASLWRSAEADAAEDFCQIRACVGPGAAPEPVAPAGGGLSCRITATPRGRLVLNRLVYALSDSLAAAANIQCVAPLS